MENAGHHTDDKFNVKEENGRVLGKFLIIFSKKTRFSVERSIARI